VRGLQRDGHRQAAVAVGEWRWGVRTRATLKRCRQVHEHGSLLVVVTVVYQESGHTHPAG
jgi:hypothetical protein